MDEIDIRIITALQENGRISNAELARMIDLAPSSTLERVRKLEERGVIKGYRAVLDPHALGLHVQAMVLINLDRHQAGPIDEFEARVRAVPEVAHCFHVTGRYDYMLHIIVRDIEHLRNLITHCLATIRGVEKQETFLVLSTVKEHQGFSVMADNGEKGKLALQINEAPNQED